MPAVTSARSWNVRWLASRVRSGRGRGLDDALETFDVFLDARPVVQLQGALEVRQRFLGGQQVRDVFRGVGEIGVHFDDEISAEGQGGPQAVDAAGDLELDQVEPVKEE